MSDDKINVDTEIVDDCKSMKTLQEFGYYFNELGKLRHIDSGDPFNFHFYEDHSLNQARYEAVGDILTEHVYRLLIDKVNLSRLRIPMDGLEDNPTSFIFVSDDIYTNCDKVMVFIHGSGVVRAGQWARSLIINDCLDSGTQLPYIERALSDGYAVLVMNTNLNFACDSNESKLPITGSESPEEHADYVWKHVISNCKANNIVIVAHSYGGAVTMETYNRNKVDFQDRVFAIAFTDSVHNIFDQTVSDLLDEDYLLECTKNWVSSSEPIDTPILSSMKDIVKVSAGTSEHTRTSWSSYNSIFKFISSKYPRINGYN